MRSNGNVSEHICRHPHFLPSLPAKMDVATGIGISRQGEADALVFMLPLFI